jgi:endonuclease-3
MNPLIPLILDKLFPDPPVPLNHSNPFTLLIAVLLSAQCTDIKVNQVTDKLFSFGNHPQDFIELGQETIEEIIKPLGLYKTKARHIIKLCQQLTEKYVGKVPEELEELEKLPGVGHKTASCVISQAFQKPAFPVDTHIHRLALRWGLSNGKSVEQTEKDLKKAFRKNEWNRRHLQIIFYARAYCPARGHKIEKCPICKALSI